MTKQETEYQENCSENRRRGRPSTREHWEQTRRMLCPETRSIRAVQNRVYMGKAMAFLREHWRPEFAWLFHGDEAGPHGAMRHLRATHLTELGRCAEVFQDDDVLMVAKMFCEHQVSAQIAIRLSRQFRGTAKDT